MYYNKLEGGDLEMNPDDQNSSQGGGTPPVDTPASTPAPETPAQPIGGGEPAETVPESQPTSANCHCGRPSSGGSCTGCNQPEAGCSCTPAA